MGEAGENWRAIVTMSLARMEFIKTGGRRLKVSNLILFLVSTDISIHWLVKNVG